MEDLTAILSPSVVADAPQLGANGLDPSGIEELKPTVAQVNFLDPSGIKIARSRRDASY